MTLTALLVGALAALTSPVLFFTGHTTIGLICQAVFALSAIVLYARA